MTPPKRPQIGSHYLDSGPLFCLGGSEVLADLFDVHVLPRSHVVGAVVAEVAHNANLVLPPVGPHRKRGVKQAARVVQGRYRQLISAAEVVPTPAPALLADMKTELQARAHATLQPGTSLHPLKNDGEVESVFRAKNAMAEVIANDADAHFLAARHGVISSTFVEVARHLVKAQKAVKRNAIYRELAALTNRDIFPGEHLYSELDLI